MEMFLRKDVFMNINLIRYSILSFTFLLLVSFASGKELKSDELNYSIAVPDGWTVTFQNAAGCSIASADGKQTMTLLIRNSDSATLDSTTTAEIEQSLIKAGAKKVSSKNFTIGGVPAYELVYSIGKSPFASTTVTHLMIANSKLYNLSGMHIGGNVLQDAELCKGLASFHFLQPPKP